MRRAEQVLVVVGIVVLSINLRPAAVSVGPVLEEVSAGLSMGSAQTSLLTSLPLLSFATIGGLAPRIAGRLGLHRSTLVALLLLVGGLWLRTVVDDARTFLALSFIALAGMAVANVLLPSLVRLHFPDRVGLLTAVYSTGLSVGITASSVLTVPIAEHGGVLDWRRGLVTWALTAAVAAVPWLLLVRQDLRARAVARTIGTGDVARTRLGWTLAAFFGLQSLQAYAVFGWMATIYRDAGLSAHEAGLLLGVVTGITIPLAFVVPALTARLDDPRLLLTAMMVCYPIGYGGLLLAPRSGAVLWAAAIGIGTCTFPFILTLIGLRARTPGGTAALSAFTQSVGYLIAVAGPFTVGALHDLTDDWTVPICFLLALCLPQWLLGLRASRPAYVEDEIANGIDHGVAARHGSATGDS